MKFFSDNNIYNIYKIKKQENNNLIKFTVLMLIVIIMVITIIIFIIVDTKLRINQSKKFEAQILEFNQEQEEIKVKKEAEEQKKEEERLAKIPNLTDEGKENIRNIYESENKIAYLTFDDGPSNNTKDILDILNANNIKATFFVLGSQVSYFPETTKRIYDEGHYIANHGYSHVYTQIYQSPETVLAEFNQCNEVVANTIGVGGSYGGKYAELKSQAISLLEENNIVYLDWNSLTGDSEKADPTEEYLMNNLQRTTDGKNSIVLLMHDSQAKRVTVDFLQKAIDYLKEQGYEFENFYSIIK